jgi:hypothetical protein
LAAADVVADDADGLVAEVEDDEDAGVVEVVVVDVVLGAGVAEFVLEGVVSSVTVIVY